MSKTVERVPFRLINTECCGALLCWVNPRLPNYCPECGTRCYPHVKGWVLSSDNTATLHVDDKLTQEARDKIANAPSRSLR